MVAVVPQQSNRQSLLNLEGEDFLRNAYLYALDRPIDASGLQTYLMHLAAGTSREVILSELESSAEGQRVALRRGKGRSVIGTSPRSSSTSVHVSPVVVQPGAKSDSALVSSVADLVSIPNDDVFLRTAYLHLLRREADPSGLANYTEQLAKGVAREQVILELATSPEGHQADASLPGLADLIRKQLTVAPLPEVNHVNDLLALRAEVFVRAAYMAVLRREADPEGLALYTDLLKEGWSRSYVLNELIRSEEGRSLQPDLRGLKPLLKRYRKGQSRSWRGWYHRAVKGAESDLPQDRLLRAALLAGR